MEKFKILNVIIPNKIKIHSKLYLTTKVFLEYYFAQVFLEYYFIHGIERIKTEMIKMQKFAEYLSM